MQLKGIKHKYLAMGKKIIIVALIIVLTTGNSLVAQATPIPTRGTDDGTDEIKNSVEDQGISFDKAWVEAGKPLKVRNAPEGSSFKWVITSPSGAKHIFTTVENYYIPKQEDEEKLISVSLVGQESVNTSIYFSTLPVVYINSSHGYHEISGAYSEAGMNIQGSAEYGKQKQVYSGNASIKLGDSEVNDKDKRPFHIKFEEEESLLGLGVGKQWELLANDIDHTLMRNKLLYEFATDLGMEGYSNSENVVLIFNNEYYGVYQLCESIGVGEEKVNIFDWEKAAEKASDAIVEQLINTDALSYSEGEESNQSNTMNEAEAKSLKQNIEIAMKQDLSWITSPYTFRYDVDSDGTPETYIISDFVQLPEPTGGVLLKMDASAFDKNAKNTMITDYSQPIFFIAPEYAKTNNYLYNNIRRIVQSFEHALHSIDFTYHDTAIKYRAENQKGGTKNPGYKQSVFSAPVYDGKHYSEMFDMDSLVQYFFLNEFSMDWKSRENTAYFYKDVDDLFYMGSILDFDQAWGNINRSGIDTWFPTRWNITNDLNVSKQYYQTVQWNQSLIRDPFFLERVYEKYKKIRKTTMEDLIKEGGKLDQYIAKYRAAATANDERWGYSYEEYKSEGFEKSTIYMKQFLISRIAWMDRQMESIDTFIGSLNSYHPSKDLVIDKIDKKAVSNFVEITTKINNPKITSITMVVNGTHHYTAKVKKGNVVYRIPTGDLISSSKIRNVIQVLAMDEQGNYILDSVETGNYSLAKSNYAVFYFDKNIDGIKQTVNDAVSSVKEQTKGYYILQFIAGIVSVLCILGIVFIVKARKS